MKRILLLFMMIVPVMLLGQGSAVPINVSLYNEATAIPFTRFFTTPIHPGIQLGTEFNYVSKAHARLFQTANLSYFYHHHLVHGIGLNSELGFEYRLDCGFAATGHLGVGYMHTFSLVEEFSLSNGEYVQGGDKGNARLTPMFALGIGYYLKKASAQSPMVFVRYQPWVEYPYSPDFIPVMTHINLHLGAKFFIHPNARKND